MQHFTTIIDSAESLAKFINQPVVKNATSVLVQIYSGQTDEEWIHSLQHQLRATIPGAVVAGLTSSGEIVEGRVINGCTER